MAKYKSPICEGHQNRGRQNRWITVEGIETFGSWGSEGHKLVKEIGKRVIEETVEKCSAFFLFQSISIAIQRGNTSCILGTVGWPNDIR